VVPGQRRSREKLYDHDDIILLDPTMAASHDDSHKPLSPLQEKPSCPIDLPDTKRHKLLEKSKSLAADLHPPHASMLSSVDRTRSVGEIELPSMKKRTKPTTLHNYRTKKILEDRLVHSDIMVWCVYVCGGTLLLHS